MDHLVNYINKPINKRMELNDFLKQLSVNDVSDMIEKIDPKLWKRLNTKFYDVPHTHYSFKLVAATLATAILDSKKRTEGSRAGNNLGTIAALLEQYDFPTYYISDPILQAMQHTNPPKDFTWKDVFFPYPAMVFMPPRKTLFEPSGAEIGMIGVAKFPVDMKIIIPGTNQVSTSAPGWTEDRISVFWSVYSGMFSQDCTFPISQQLQPSVDWIALKTDEYRDVNGMNVEGAPSNEFSSYLSGVVANLVLLMQVRESQVEKGVKTTRKLKSGPSIWSPTWLGRKYVVERQERSQSTGQAHFTEIGWRSGHYRMQHFGTGNLQEKMILIDPYMAFTRGLVKR